MESDLKGPLGRKETPVPQVQWALRVSRDPLVWMVSTGSMGWTEPLVLRAPLVPADLRELTGREVLQGYLGWMAHLVFKVS